MKTDYSDNLSFSIRLRACLFLLGILFTPVASSSVFADEPNEELFGFTLPTADSVFEQFFGEESEEDLKELEKIEVTPQEERRMGDEAARNYLLSLKRQGYKVERRGRDVTYLKSLVNKMRSYMKNADRYPSIRIYLVNSPEKSSYCFPGGNLVFFRGMIDAAGSEATLAGIIGHELSHLDRSHQLRQFRRAKLAQQSFDSTDRKFDPERFFRGGSMMIRIWTRPFNPKDESIADKDGATWAYRAGYDPREMAKFFLKAHRDGKRKKANPVAFFRSHPFNIDRYKAVLTLYRELQKNEPQKRLYIGRSNLRHRTPRSEREFTEFAKR